jgi:hypothetical protein
MLAKLFAQKRIDPVLVQQSPRGARGFEILPPKLKMLLFLFVDRNSVLTPVKAGQANVEAPVQLYG